MKGSRLHPSCLCLSRGSSGRVLSVGPGSGGARQGPSAKHVLVGDACSHPIPWASPQGLPRAGEVRPMPYHRSQGAAWLRVDPLRPWLQG